MRNHEEVSREKAAQPGVAVLRAASGQFANCPYKKKGSAEEQVASGKEAVASGEWRETGNKWLVTSGK
jgi:hypothetical protein